MKGLLALFMFLVIPAANAAVSVSDQAILKPIEAAYHLPHGLLSAIEQTETGGNHRAVGSSGERGPFQLMPAVVRHFDVDPLNEKAAGTVAAQMLTRNFGLFHSWNRAIAAYNAGAGSIFRRGIFNLAYVIRVRVHMRHYDY